MGHRPTDDGRAKPVTEGVWVADGVQLCPEARGRGKRRGSYARQNLVGAREIPDESDAPAPRKLRKKVDWRRACGERRDLQFDPRGFFVEAVSKPGSEVAVEGSIRDRNAFWSPS